MDFSASEWAVLAQYLDEGMELNPEAQEIWLQGLSGLDPNLKQALAVMLERNRTPNDELLSLIHI